MVGLGGQRGGVAVFNGVARFGLTEQLTTDMKAMKECACGYQGKCSGRNSQYKGPGAGVYQEV